MRARAAAAALAILASLGSLAGEAITLRYAHPNEPESIAGLQAALFARKVREYSGGAASVEVHPASRLGSLKEQADQVSAGTIAFHHQTAGGIGGDFAVLDTPYLIRSVPQLLRVVDPASPVMAKLGEGLLRDRGLRVLYTFYFGTRQLTCDRPVRKPADLSGVRVRAIPSPLYEAAVEGLGAVPVPIDWAQTLVALAAGSVSGQENPVGTILSSRLYEHQSYLMLTSHILGAELVVVNEAVWQRLAPRLREAIARAAREASAYATKATLESEDRDLAALRARGMKVVGPAEGLDLAAFAARSSILVEERFGARWAPYFSMIEALR